MKRIVYDHLPEFLTEAIRGRYNVAQRRYGNKRPAAFFDFDGSLIDGDITEGKRKGQGAYLGLVERAILADLLPEFKGKEGAERFWQKYDCAFSRTEDAYLWVGQLICDPKRSSDPLFKGFIIGQLKEMIEQYAFAFARELLTFCVNEGIEPFIISASPHLFVTQISHCMPFKRENLFGICADAIIHDGEGKEKRMLDLCESRMLFPLLALGNKWMWDGPMIRKACEDGGVGILVNDDVPDGYEISSLYCINIR